MGHSSAVGFLAFALCLVACVFASAADVPPENEVNTITLRQAQETVEDAKKCITEVSEQAQSNIDNAERVLKKVKLFKNNPEEGDYKAEDAANDNKDAKALVEEIKAIFKTVAAFYVSAQEELQTAATSKADVLSTATNLNGEFDTEMAHDETNANSYSGAKNKALEIKRKAELLKTKITDASTIITRVDTKAQEMEQRANDAEVQIQISGIVFVAKIDTNMERADGIVTKKENNKQEVNTIVQQMQTLKTKASSESTERINALFNTANNALSEATNSVEKAKQSKAAMTKQQQKAHDALTNAQKATDASEATKEVQSTMAYATKVEEMFSELSRTLKAANDAVTNANDSKEKMETALPTATGKERTEQSKETTEDNPPVVEGTDSQSKDATKQPTSKDPPDQSDNSGDKRKGTGNKDAQNVPTTALTGGKAPAPGAKNDSAMTVSVTLLVALIASAVLQ